MKHVRDRNRVAVGLDFVIVVGIFVGLLVAESNEQRIAKAREQAWLIQLGVDLASMADRELSGQIAGLFDGLETSVEFIDSVRIALPVIHRVAWQHIDLSLDEDGRPIVAGIEFDAAYRQREVRNAVREIEGRFHDRESIAAAAVTQLDSTRAALALHLETGRAR